MIFSIVNPTSGHGLGKKVGRQIDDLLRGKEIPHQMLYTQWAGQATELAKQAQKDGATMVIAIGGDGTAFEVAQGLIGTELPFAIIPAGTGNDFVKTVAVPMDPAQALEHILASPARKTDVGMINDRLFLNEVGTGFDVMVLDYAAHIKRYFRGMIPYFYGVLQSLFRFRSIDLTYTLEDGAQQHQRAFVMAVANGGCIGGGIQIAPDARADDGLFDVVIVGEIKRRYLLQRLIGLMKGKILSFPETRFQRVRSVSFGAANMRVNIDGEVMSFDCADVRMMPGALLMHR